MSKEKATCPVCKLVYAYKDNYTTQEGHYQYECPRCGKYAIDRHADHTIEREPDLKKRMKISAWIRNYFESRKEPYILDWETFQKIESILPDYSVLEKQLRLLQNIERRTENPGQRVTLNIYRDIPLAWATNEEEFRFHINSLGNRHFIVQDSTMSGDFSIWITSLGWEYLDKHRSDIEERTQAFIAMSFNPKLITVWKNAIKPAIEEAGYTAMRVDMDPHNEKIDAKIMTEIKNSRFMVADFTENKHGVYFEAGFALGLGIPVLWCVNKKDLKNLHFDTRQYGHIDWESEEELKEKLYSYICSIIGKRQYETT